MLPTSSFSGMVVGNHAFYWVMQIMNNPHYAGHRNFLTDPTTRKKVSCTLTTVRWTDARVCQSETPEGSFMATMKVVARGFTMAVLLPADVLLPSGWQPGPGSGIAGLC